ncbi:MAG: hypothetical protein Q9226_008919 [Calogaya cf. arnoldii]
MNPSLKLLKLFKPSFEAKRAAHIAFTSGKIEKRLNLKTDRKDSMSYTTVGVHQWSTFRSATNFAFPDTFDPERFLPTPPEKYRNDNLAALQAFSLGPRGCIGKG